MELLPKLIAAADMCEQGEDVNLDELSFLLRYAADELDGIDVITTENHKLMDKLRDRVKARCDLLDRGEHDLARANEGTLEELERLDEELERELHERYPEADASFQKTRITDSSFNPNQHKSGSPAAPYAGKN